MGEICKECATLYNYWKYFYALLQTIPKEMLYVHQMYLFDKLSL